MASIPPWADLQAKVDAIPHDAFMCLEKAIVHASCPDGIASAMLIRHFSPQLPIEFVFHGTPQHHQEPCRALFCDFSPPAERAQEWADAGAIVLDHHASAKPVVELFGDRGVFADEKEHPGVSGALLAFMLSGPAFRYPENQRFAELVGIRDTWQRSHHEWPEACAVASALTFYPVEDLLRKRGLEPYQVETGRLIYEARLRRAAEVAASTADDVYAGRSFLLFNDGREKLTSDVGETARELGRPWHFVAGFFYTETGTLVFSLRSVAPAFDVSKIAIANGGGGHTRAAGFQVDCSFGDSPAAAMARALDRVRQ